MRLPNMAVMAPLLARPAVRRGCVSLAMVAVFTAGSASAATAPVNDRRQGAVRVRRLPFDDVRSTRGATTTRIDRATPCYGRPRATAWYSWTAPRDMRVGAHTVGSRYDTNIGVFRRTAEGLRLVTCNRDRFKGAEARVVFEAVKGRTYHFSVGADSGNGGRLRFRIVKNLMPRGETLGYEVDQVQSHNPVSGTTAVRVHFACSEPATVVITRGTLTQSAGASATFSDRFACHGTTVRTYRFEAGYGFGPGNAELAFRMQADTFGLTTDSYLPDTVTLIDPR